VSGGLLGLVSGRLMEQSRPSPLDDDASDDKAEEQWHQDGATSHSRRSNFSMSGMLTAALWRERKNSQSPADAKHEQ